MLPIFCDIEKDYNTMCPVSLKNTIKIALKRKIKLKYIIPVHMYGQLSDMEKINNIAAKYNLIVIEDCSQSHGAKFIKSKKFKTKFECLFTLPYQKFRSIRGCWNYVQTTKKLHFSKLINLREYGWKNRICIDKERY